eukprot:11017033-Prorocentrum_lima.AAC.1
MTSSLVGSEMCIRDRSTPIQPLMKATKQQEMVERLVAVAPALRAQLTVCLLYTSDAADDM